jgi:hypothetical protein
VIIIGVVAGVLVVCGLIVLVALIARRRKSKSKDEAEAGDNSVSLVSMTSNASEGHYQSITSPYQPLEQTHTGVEVATSDEKLAHIVTKSWEIKYSELKILETVGEGSFATVHRAIYSHQQVAVKQLKNQINQKDVGVQH